jgi:crotonobetainyl-CoA:carnitine CoA-transferase CaiB-like acyl-CoA transferase
MVDSPVRLTNARRRGDTPPPVLGEHTEAILTSDLGLTGGDVRRLREQGIV